MLIFPAIDLYDGKAVRLYKGDYNQKTVYSDDPTSVAMNFKNMGAAHVHLVDLEGAKTGDTPNFEIVRNIKAKTGLFCEIGGGIRNMDTIDKYISCGLDRVILGTSAVTDEAFLKQAIIKYGDKISVGVDINNGMVAIKGWLESSGIECFNFCKKMQDIGVHHIICTDISKDGAMMGTNYSLYKNLSEKFSIKITASGGVSSIEDIKRLRKLNLYGAIIGKAYYNGAIDLTRAIEVAN